MKSKTTFALLFCLAFAGSALADDTSRAAMTGTQKKCGEGTDTCADNNLNASAGNGANEMGRAALVNPATVKSAEKQSQIGRHGRTAMARERIQPATGKTE